MEWHCSTVWRCLLLGCVLLVAPAGAAPVPAEQKTFDSIYGQRVKSAVTPAQKVDLARQLLKDAGPLTDVQFQAFLYQKAFDLASAAPAGFPVAVEAMDELAKARPEQAAGAGQKVLSILARESQSGPFADRRFAADEYMERLLPLAQSADDSAADAMIRRAMPVAELAGRGWVAQLSELSKAIRQRQAVRRTVTTLQAKFEQNPRDASVATELVQALTLELDRPDEALAYVGGLGEPTRQVLAWATKPAASLSPDEQLAVGQWYKDQTGPSAGLRRSVALRRARLYFQLFLNGHTEPDAARLRATAAMADLTRAAAKDKGLEGPQIDLLTLVDPARDALAGKWTTEPGGLVSPAGPATRLLIPYEPPAEYNFRVTFQRNDKTAEFLFFPVAGRNISWTCSCWNGVTSGLDMVGGKDSRSNPTTRQLPESNAPGPHTVEIRVRVDSISTFFDGALVVRHMTNGSDLSPAGPATGAYSLGLGAGNSPASGTTFSRVELFEVNGRGRPLKHPR